MLKKVFILAPDSRSIINFRSQLILDLSKKGFEVHVCAPKLSKDREVVEWLRYHRLRWHDIPLNRNGLNPFRDLCALFSLIRLLKNEKPNLLISYTIKPVIWGAFAAKWMGVPKCVALITGLGYAFIGAPSGKRKLIQFLARKLYALALQRTDLVFFQNKDDKEDFKRMGLLPPDVPVYIVNGSGVNTKEYPVSPFPRQPLTFLLIARLLGDKGIREYVRAAQLVKQKYPDVRFQIVGELDSNPDALKQREVDNWCNEGLVEWYGYQSDVRPFIRGCHVFVLPSYREGTPRAVLEAMSMGRAIVTTNAPGCKETVRHGENGFLVAVQSSAELAETMQAFIKSPDLIFSMGSRSREIVVERYDVYKVNQEMFEAMNIV